MKTLIATLALLLFSGIAAGQTTYQFTGQGASWTCSTFNITEVNYVLDADGSIRLCTLFAQGVFSLTRYDVNGSEVESFTDLVITHGFTQAEPWLAFTYNGGRDSAVLNGKWQVVYKSGLKFFYTGGVLTEN